MELFNLDHSELHNVVEHVFGVLKWKFWILLLPTEYDMEIQARLPAALSAIHNFTRDHNSEISEDKGPNINNEIYHQDGGGYFEAEGLVEDEDEEGKTMWDNIAEHMWRDCQDYIAEGDSEEYGSSEGSEEE